MTRMTVSEVGARLTRAIIGIGIAMSLLIWGAGRAGAWTFHAIRPGAIAADWAPMPEFSVHLSVEVRS